MESEQQNNRFRRIIESSGFSSVLVSVLPLENKIEVL